MHINNIFEHTLQYGAKTVRKKKKKKHLTLLQFVRQQLNKLLKWVDIVYIVKVYIGRNRCETAVR